MKISDMDAILKVIQLNGLAPAADALFLTQPALSQIIRRVESELHTTLFIRRPGKSFELTESGMQFAETAQQICDTYQEYLKTLEPNTSPLRIGISSHCGNQVVRAFFDSDPDFSEASYDFVEFNSNKERELAVQNHTLDLATLRLPILTSGLTCKIVYREKLGIWLRKGSPAEALAQTVPGEKYRVLPISALNQEPMALPSASSRMHACIERILKRYQITPSSTCSFSNMSYIMLMAEQGKYNSISRAPKPNENDERFFLMTPCEETYDLAIVYHPKSKRLRDIEKVYHMLLSYYSSMT